MTSKHRRWVGFLAFLGVALLLGSGVALAQEAPPPPPPAPIGEEAPPPPAANPLLQARPPVKVIIVGRGPALPRVLPPPLPRERRRIRRRASPWGRFYVGTGAGYLWPGGELGRQYESGGAWTLWTGWRKRWLGFELGYLGAQLTRRYGEAPVITTDVPTGASTVWDPYSGDAYLSQLTMDAKVFWTILCKSSLFARLGLNYTVLDYGTGFARDGFGWQAGAGWDYRIRLAHAPDLILKLRAEALYTWAKIKCGEGDCRDISGVAALFYVNLGWSP